MRIFLLVAFVLCGATVQAQEFKCPDVFPEKSVAFDTPLGQPRSARLQPARLSMSYMYEGELYGQQYLAGPDVASSKDGMEIRYGFQVDSVKWLVCVYGGSEWSRSKPSVMGNVELWTKLNPNVTSCVLRVRKFKTSYDPPAWAASALCK